MYSNFVVLLPSLKFTSTFNPVFIDEFPSDVNDIDSVLKENSIKTINYIDKNDNVLSHHRNVLINIFIISWNKCSRNLYYIALNHNIKIILHGDIPQLSTTCSHIPVIQYVNTYNSLNVLRKIVPSFGFLITRNKMFVSPIQLTSNDIFMVAYSKLHCHLVNIIINSATDIPKLVCLMSGSIKRLSRM